MKKPFFFKTRIENSIPDLFKAYRERCNPILDGQRYPFLAQSVEQLFMYLNACGIGYGIISSADLSYFLRHVGDTLYISQGVEWQNPKFVAALSYFLEEAQRNTPANAFGEEWKHTAGSSEGLIDDSEDSAVSDHDLVFVPKNFTITGTDRRSTRSMHVDPCSTLEAGSDLKEMPVEHLNLDSHPFARGWSGNIVRGTYEGVSVAVKLALVGTDRAEALLNEASAYLRLQNCWGTYTPTLVSHGTTADGNLVYIATELIEGLELGMGTLTPEVVEASFEALNAIHGFGLLHGDVRPANILVPRTGWQGVRFIDFGFSRSIATDVDCRKELQELQELLGVVRQWYPCTRASPPPGQIAQPENRMILPSSLPGNQSRQAVF